jgi:hypothetical protein
MTFLEDLELIPQLRERFRGSDLYELEDHVFWAFLKGTKFDIDRAEDSVVTVINTREKVTNERIINFDGYIPPPELSEIAPYKVLGYDAKDRTVVWAAIGNINLNEFIRNGQKEALLKYICKVIDDLGKEIYNQSLRVGRHVKGVWLVDTKDLSAMNFLNWEFIRLAAGAAKDIEPLIRLCNAVYVVNCSWGYYYLFKIVKQFIPKTAASKLEVLDADAKNWNDDVQNNFSMDLIPREYGGNGVKVFG